MKIKTKCMNCKSPVRADEKLIGKRVKCPKCGNPFVLEYPDDMAYDVFVCHSSHDRQTANVVCSQLEEQGIRCWMAPRDILPGSEYGASIIKAIHRSRSLVLVFSKHANQSPQVRREVERAASWDIPIIPLRIEDEEPSEAMEYFISAHQWMDATQPPIERHIQQMADKLRQMLSKTTSGSYRQSSQQLKPSVSSTNVSTKVASEPQSDEEGLYEWGHRLAFTMGYHGLFLIFLKGTIQSRAPTDEIEQEEWRRFEYASNQLGVKSGLRDHLGAVAKIPPNEVNVTLSQHVIEPLSQLSKTDVRYRLFANLGAQYTALNLWLQLEAAGQNERRQGVTEAFRNVVLVACQAFLPLDTINHLRSLQQKHAESRGQIELHMLQRELVETVLSPLLTGN